MSYRVLGTDRILETAEAPGTDAVNLGNPVPGYRSFSSVLESNDTCTYFIEAVDDNGVSTVDWERGFATFINDTDPQLVRSVIMDSSNSGNFVDFTSAVRVGSAPMSETIAVGTIPGGRLSVSMNDPVADGESDTLYYIPYYNDLLPIFNGYGLQTVTAASTSISVASLPAGSAYDVFCYIVEGTLSVTGATLSLELNPWTDPNTRNDSLEYAYGFLCKSGDPTRRFLGSCYIGSDGLIQDWGNYQGVSQNPAKRFLWNLYNRVRRDAYMFDETASWTVLGDNNWRIIDGLTAPQGCLEFFRGADDDLVEVNGLVNANVQPNSNYYSAIGLDADTPVTESSIYGNFNNSTNKSINLALSSFYRGRPGIGYHNVRLLEKLRSGMASGGSDSQSGLLGTIFA